VRIRPFVLVAAVLVLSTVGCAPADRDGREGTGADVVVRDFALEAPSRLAAGPLTLRVHNEGPDDHELLLVRRSGPLPMRADGLTIDEDGIEDDTVVALEPVEPGSVTELHVKLEPGRYEFVCNMLGHYMGGMHSTLVVS
jgi:uncharacterized cupredoxin-like copper-binding protein